jgi:hypothetical protein
MPANRFLIANLMHPLWACSFDHLVGAREQLVWHSHAKRLGGVEVDHQLELRCLLNGKISRLVSIENTGGVNANLAICVGKAGAVA